MAVLMAMAIAGVVAVFAYMAMPGRESSLSRAQVADAMVIAGHLKLVLAEHYRDRKQWPKSLNEVTTMTNGKFVESTSITKGAGAAGEFEFAIAMDRQNSNDAIRGRTFYMRSTDGGVSWICGAGTIEEKYLPAPCRTPSRGSLN
jgi:type IV pilus assembly protein PilA